MSYEGYEVYYCKNGHRIGSWDVYDPENPSPYLGIDKQVLRCPVCGLVEFVVDCVDQTNGCECEFMPEGKMCGCHEKVNKVVGYSEIVCSKCRGQSTIEMPEIYQDVPCAYCHNNGETIPSCEYCNGSGIIRQAMSFVEIECTDCKGTGKEYIPVYDISPIVRNK